MRNREHQLGQGEKGESPLFDYQLGSTKSEVSRSQSSAAAAVLPYIIFSYKRSRTVQRLDVGRWKFPVLKWGFSAYNIVSAGDSLPAYCTAVFAVVLAPHVD